MPQTLWPVLVHPASFILSRAEEKIANPFSSNATAARFNFKGVRTCASRSSDEVAQEPITRVLYIDSNGDFRRRAFTGANYLRIMRKPIKISRGCCVYIRRLRHAERKRLVIVKIFVFTNFRRRIVSPSSSLLLLSHLFVTHTHTHTIL